MRRASLDLLRLALLAAVTPLACTGKGEVPTATQREADKEPEPAPPPACPGDVTQLEFGAPTGFARCGDDSVHRVKAIECKVPARPENACPAGVEINGDCRTNLDCSAKPHGRCVEYSSWKQRSRDEAAYCGCVYSCETDADCLDAGACLCVGALELKDGSSYPESLPTCVPAACRTDADCSAGECGAAAYHDGCHVEAALRCREEGDVCRAHDQCGPTSSCVVQERRADRPARWQCLGRACEVGRLLRVGDGPPRVAATRRGAGWRAASIVVAPVADAAHRAALAEHWREVALLEHASVASFARFTRQLLSLGAPITLVQEASAAMRDEIEHARLAFAVAAAYGDPSTPGTLDATRVTAGPPTRLEVARALIDEACVAETLGVAEALGAAEACEDPAIRDVLEAIAGDELRHAALAWRSLRWLLTTSAQAERRQIAASLQAALVDGARASSTAVAPGRDDPRRGLLGPRRRHELRRRALRQVIEPCARALLAAFAGDRPAAAPSVTCSIEHV